MIKDILKFKNELSGDEKLISESAYDYCQNELMPRIKHANRNETFDKEIYKEFGSMGFLGAPIMGYGCPGVNYVSYGLIAREIERVDSGYRSAFSVQTSLAMYAIYKFGSEDQKEFYLPQMAKGNLIGCFGLTEPDAGSDPSSMKTKAIKVDGGYKINGSKTWITNSPIADVLIVWAKDEQDILRGFIVDRDIKGIETPHINGKFSLRASATGQIFLQDVFIKDDKVLPDVQSFRGPFSCLNMARYGIAWGAIGAAMNLYEVALKYSKDREQFGRPIAGFQLIQEKLVWMLNEITKGQIIAMQVGRNKDNESLKHPQVSLIKRNNVWVARECAKLAREILGANGVTSDYPIMRHMMNIESVYTYEGTHEMHTLILGHEITGIQAFH